MLNRSRLRRFEKESKVRFRNLSFIFSPFAWFTLSRYSTANE